MEIICDAGWDMAVSAGKLYVSAKIGAIVGSYTCEHRGRFSVLPMKR